MFSLIFSPLSSILRSPLPPSLYLKVTSEKMYIFVTDPFESHAQVPLMTKAAEAKREAKSRALLGKPQAASKSRAQIPTAVPASAAAEEEELE